MSEPAAPTAEEINAALQAQLAETQAKLSVFEDGYNRLHGENLNLQMTVKVQARQIESLTAQLAVAQQLPPPKAPTPKK
jgi:hypothetical protein